MGFAVLARFASTSRSSVTPRAMISHVRLQSTSVPRGTPRVLPSFSLENKVSHLHCEVLRRGHRLSDRTMLGMCRHRGCARFGERILQRVYSIVCIQPWDLIIR